jgi:type II secretory ATPase GspE/PulE/Tfp pilus assembly ATPase PilB-like protein
VFEAVVLSEEIANAIAHGETEDELRVRLRSAGAISLEADAMHKVATGITDPAEALAIHWS